MKTVKSLVLFMLCSFLLFPVNPAAAHAVSGGVPGTPSNLQGPGDPIEVETFLDRLFSQQMEEYHLAGITAVMVKDGEVLFQKGYGYADIENQIPVDPAKTIFRIGSTTKLFTWTAVLQLVEQGKLDLDADINTYLDFQIPSTYPDPISVKHLMSHTAGFEDRTYELGAPTADRIQPLGQYLATHMPARVYPPGQVSSYSNYGTDLAGYIVERISGISYTDYIEKNILEPLEMSHSTPLQPLPSHLAADMSTGYRYIKNEPQTGDFELLSTIPCGGISSTAADMARFMKAHLQGGSLCPDIHGGDTPSCGEILREPTEELMHSPLWWTSPRVTGLSYGFLELHLNGQRILYHPGDTTIFHSLLILLPDENLGFFVSYNTDSPGFFWDVTLYEFMNHFYPVEPTAIQPAAGFSSRAEIYTGGYHLVRSTYTTIEKVKTFLVWIEITPAEDGTLLLGSPFSPQKVRLEELEPMLFQEPNHGKQFVFQDDEQGKFIYLYDVSQPVNPYVKAPWHRNPMLHLGLLGACILIFLSVFLAVFSGGVARLYKREVRAIQPDMARVARWLSFLVALLFFSALVAFLVIFLDPHGFEWMIGLGQMSTINIILAVWLLGAVLTITLAVMTALAWMNRFWSVIARVHYTLMTLAALAFVWFLNYWNLLGFRY